MRVVLIVNELGIETIRPIALSEAESREAGKIINQITPAIEMMKALLQGEQRETEKAVEV